MSKFSAVIMLAAAMLSALGQAQVNYNCINQLIDGQPGLTVEAGHDKIFCDAVLDWSRRIENGRSAPALVDELKIAPWRVEFDKSHPNMIKAVSPIVTEIPEHFIPTERGVDSGIPRGFLSYAEWTCDKQAEKFTLSWYIEGTLVFEFPGFSPHIQLRSNSGQTVHNYFEEDVRLLNSQTNEKDATFNDVMKLTRRLDQPSLGEQLLAAQEINGAFRTRTSPHYSWFVAIPKKVDDTAIKAVNDYCGEFLP